MPPLHPDPDTVQAVTLSGEEQDSGWRTPVFPENRFYLLAHSNVGSKSLCTRKCQPAWAVGSPSLLLPSPCALQRAGFPVRRHHRFLHEQRPCPQPSARHFRQVLTHMVLERPRHVFTEASRTERGQGGKWPCGVMVPGRNGTSLGTADPSPSFSGYEDQDVPGLKRLTGHGPWVHRRGGSAVGPLSLGPLLLSILLLCEYLSGCLHCPPSLIWVLPIYHLFLLRMHPCPQSPSVWVLVWHFGQPCVQRESTFC